MPRATLRALVALVAIVVIDACGGGRTPAAPTPAAPPAPTTPSPLPPTTGPRPWNLATDGVPRFITQDYLDLNTITRISRFRSAEGHSYADAVESCRSMKHYFQPRSAVDWGTVPIVSPVKGVISRTTAEWAGTQIEIQSSVYPAFSVVIFHVNLAGGLAEGVTLEPGQLLGTHVGPQTTSDVAVRVDSTEGMRLVSYFDGLTDDVFGRYQSRGVESRDALIISRAERDASPLSCDGEAFISRGTINGWIPLR